MVEGEAPDAGEAIVAPKEETDSQSTVDPSLVAMAVGDVGGLALVPHGEEVGPSGDLLIWPHPVDPHEPLFMVDDMVEQAAWADTSLSHRGS